MPDKTSNKSFWSLICDSETVSSTCSTGINTMLVILSKLQEELPELFPIPPKATIYGIQVFTSGDSDEEIRKTAEAIRSNVEFPFIMYHYKKYVPVPDNRDKRLQYRHTPGGEFYEFCKEENSAGSYWKLINKFERSSWKLISRKKHGKKIRNKKTTSGFDELLPSQVADRDRIHLPSDEEDFERVANEKGGKWMLHCSDSETLDNLWKNLICLYDTGVLVGLKSSTQKYSVKETAPGYYTKAIMCYTADANCKSCVEKAAQSIYTCTGYDFEMYYKSNEASLNGLYRHEGFKSVTKYMITSSGEMFEKDYLNRWKAIIFNEGKHI